VKTEPSDAVQVKVIPGLEAATAQASKTKAISPMGRIVVCWQRRANNMTAAVAKTCIMRGIDAI